MIEKILETYKFTFSDRKEVLEIKEDINGNYSYNRHTYNNDDKLIGRQTITPIKKSDVYLKFEKEKDKYNKLFDIEYFNK